MTAPHPARPLSMPNRPHGSSGAHLDPAHPRVADGSIAPTPPELSAVGCRLSARPSPAFAGLLPHALSLSWFSFGGLDARVYLFWAVPALLLLAFLAERRRRRALTVFAKSAGSDRGLRRTLVRRRIRTGMLSVGILLLVFASLEPRSNPVKVREKAKMRNLVVLLDVSRSMLAKDRHPNRLESVKLELARLANHLSGTRVGLIAFAGDAVVVCPLTANYSYFGRSVETVTTATAGQGGTRIGDAIRKAIHDMLGMGGADEGAKKPQPGQTVLEKAQAKKKGRYSDLLLITDGEDHDSFPGYAAKELGQLGVGLYIVGVGSTSGAAVPTGHGHLLYEGKEVKSTLHDKALRELVVDAARGRYLPAGTAHFDLVDFYHRFIQSGGGKEQTVVRIHWQEVYQPFLLAGLVLVLVAFAVPLCGVSSSPVREEVEP